MRASATSVRFVIQEKTAQTAVRILNGFQRARSQTRWKNTANRIKDGRTQKSLAIPKSAQTRPPAKAQRSESGIPVRKRFSGFLRSRSWTGRKQRTAQGTMDKKSRKFRMTRDQNGLFILNNLLSFLYDPL